MREVAKQMMDCVSAGLYYPALITSFSLPDMCAALNSNGATTGLQYKEWFNRYVSKKDYMTGDDAWVLRCSHFTSGLLITKQI